MPRIAILHDAVDPGAGPDTQDTLVQVASVRAALAGLGHDIDTLAIPSNEHAPSREVLGLRPDLAFNLVESTTGFAQTIDRVPRMLDALGIPYTGCRAAVLRQTSDKLQAKQVMSSFGLPTPDVWNGHRDGRWIIKSVWEHASLGMDDGCVVAGHKVGALLREREGLWGGAWFAERYVEGREINVSLLETNRTPQVLAVAEIDFLDYAADKPRIVGYSAKWLQDSFEYVNTPRRFINEGDEPALRNGVIELALRCWYRFELSGYARVDLRIDGKGRPWLLDINANPCLSPDAGFAAAAAQAGIGYDEAIACIVAHARCGHPGVCKPPVAGIARS